MQAKFLCVLIHIWIRGEVYAVRPVWALQWSIFTDLSNGGTSFMDHLCFSVLCLLCLCAHLFICALWSPVWKRLTSWLSFVISNSEFVTFPLVSGVRCCT